ncbi:MAG: methyltransferase domain-containing protein [Bacteroidetes bacterium]|nr:methyltransferase domain-containing protein [Bacteroidota bacterium]
MKIAKHLGRIANPIAWLRAYRFQKSQPKYKKANKDLELQLYAQILGKDMLHYGYFENTTIDPLSLSIRDVENAQVRYAELIISQLCDLESPVLDVGCGMGGLSAMLKAHGKNVEALTPDIAQKNYIATKHPELTCHFTRYEDFSSDRKFGNIINSESLQYIPLSTALSKTNELLAPNGHWIITDYFRVTDQAHKSGHKLQDFFDQAKGNGWTIITERDITQNCLPTIRLVSAYIQRFIIPIARYANEKFRIKSPKLFYLTEALRDEIKVKANKEFDAVNPDKFASHKRYMLFVLKKG